MTPGTYSLFTDIDKQRLISFLSSDPVINPESSVTLDDSSLKPLRNLCSNTDTRTQHKIAQFSDQIRQAYSREGDISKLKQWSEFMKDLSTCRDLESFVSKLKTNPLVSDCSFRSEFEQMIPWQRFLSEIDASDLCFDYCPTYSNFFNEKAGNIEDRIRECKSHDEDITRLNNKIAQKNKELEDKPSIEDYLLLQAATKAGEQIGTVVGNVVQAGICSFFH